MGKSITNLIVEKTIDRRIFGVNILESTLTESHSPDIQFRLNRLSPEQMENQNYKSNGGI